MPAASRHCSVWTELLMHLPGSGARRDEALLTLRRGGTAADMRLNTG